MIKFNYFGKVIEGIILRENVSDRIYLAIALESLHQIIGTQTLRPLLDDYHKKMDNVSTMIRPVDSCGNICKWSQHFKLDDLKELSNYIRQDRYDDAHEVEGLMPFTHVIDYLWKTFLPMVEKNLENNNFEVNAKAEFSLIKK